MCVYSAVMRNHQVLLGQRSRALCTAVSSIRRGRFHHVRWARDLSVYCPRLVLFQPGVIPMKSPVSFARPLWITRRVFENFLATGGGYDPALAFYDGMTPSDAFCFRRVQAMMRCACSCPQRWQRWTARTGSVRYPGFSPRRERAVAFMIFVESAGACDKESLFDKDMVCFSLRFALEGGH